MELVINNNVDGSEIRRSLVEVGNLFHDLQGFHTFEVVFLQDFSHQQYGPEI